VTTTDDNDDDDDDKSTKIWVGNLRERDHLENLNVDREVNIKINVQERRYGGTERIVLAEDRDKSQAVVNAVMNLRVP
jgi:hypothetical protein